MAAPRRGAQGAVRREVMAQCAGRRGRRDGNQRQALSPAIGGLAHDVIGRFRQPGVLADVSRKPSCCRYLSRSSSLTCSCSGWLRCAAAISVRAQSGLRTSRCATDLSRRSLQVGYSYSNQFELPVLFYVLTILAYFTHHAGIVFVVLAWVFVIFRLLQAYVHVTSNKIQLRGAMFGISAWRSQSCGRSTSSRC